VGPTPEGVCLLLVSKDLVPVINSLTVIRRCLWAASQVAEGVTGVVVADKEEYATVVDETVEVVGIRTERLNMQAKKGEGHGH
jgi:hypothetical protein